MRNFFLIVMLLFGSAQAADIKLSNLPLGSAAITGVDDSFPFVDAAGPTTKRLKLSDLINLPSLAASLSQRRTTNSISTGFTIPTLTKDYILNVDTSGGAIAVILPDAVASDALCVDIKDLGSFNVNLTAPGSQKIDGSSSDALTVLNEARHYCAVSGNWYNY